MAGKRGETEGEQEEDDDEEGEEEEEEEEEKGDFYVTSPITGLRTYLG